MTKPNPNGRGKGRPPKHPEPVRMRIVARYYQMKGDSLKVLLNDYDISYGTLRAYLEEFRGMV